MPRELGGRKLARRIRAGLAEEVAARPGPPPGLAVVMVGEDPASSVYVSMKEKACRKAGIESRVVRLPDDVTRERLLGELDALNRDGSVHGILCQLPLPAHLSADEVASAVLPEKDVDGFHPENVGRLFRGMDGLRPCTPSGIVALLDEHGVTIDGARAVVLGRSNIVGKPVAGLLLARHATVTVAHSHTRDLPPLCREADILVVAVGRPRFVTAEHVAPGATVVDVGIHRTDDGLVGDVDRTSVDGVCGAITPVPGGVGPLTIAFLLENTVNAWRSARGLPPSSA